MKDQHRLLVVDLSRRKELDVTPKDFQEIEFVGQSKKLYNDSDNVESMFVLTIL